MENKSGRRISFNFFDIIIIVLVIALAAGFVLFQKRGSSSGDAAAGMQTVQYQVEVTNLTADISDQIKAGDTIVDKIKKQEMGKVTAAEVYPMKKAAVNMETGDTLYSDVPDEYAALITIETECKDTGSALAAASGYQVRVGTDVSILGPGYGGGGFVVNVMRGDK